MEIGSIGIIGAGAVGIALAGQLDTTRTEVTFFADKSRVNRYEKNGFILNGTHVPFSYACPNTDSKPQDLLIITTKSFHLTAALALCKPLVHKNTIFISLINGISSEQQIKEQFPDNPVLPAMIIGIDAVREGDRITNANNGTIHFGGNPEAVSAVCSVFNRNGISYECPENIERTLWWKFMVNTGINQASAVLKAPYGVFQKKSSARDLMIAAMREVILVSEHEGINLNEKDLKQWLDVLATLNPGGKTSMLQDVEAGRQTESELFGGTLCSIAEKHGIKCPVNKTLLQILDSLPIE